MTNYLGLNAASQLPQPFTGSASGSQHGEGGSGKGIRRIGRGEGAGVRGGVAVPLTEPEADTEIAVDEVGVELKADVLVDTDANLDALAGSAQGARSLGSMDVFAVLDMVLAFLLDVVEIGCEFVVRSRDI